jgi:DNA-binding NtrC family response regulator
MSLRPTAPEPTEPAALDEDTLQDDRGRLARSGPRCAHEFLFVVLESDRPLSGGARYALDGIDEIVIGRGRERGAVREVSAGVRRLLLRLPSRRLSSVHARIQRRAAGWVASDEGSTNGSYVNGERVTRAPLGTADVLEVGRVFLMLSSAETREDQPPLDLDGAELAAQPAAFATLRPDISLRLSDLSRLARTDITVLLCGETGTGKEVLSNAIHQLSNRTGPLVPVNCGALASTLVEAQLFGHVRGAFSGALADSIGFIRAAEGGTLLLDEAQDLSSSGQAALLRVLQEREVVPVGSARAVKVDVRFIATVPVPLERSVRAGKFRADLQGRLQGFAHALLPLRERREDLGVLSAALLSKAGVSDADTPTLSLEFALHLIRHPWPLNVRELEQCLIRGWALSRAGCIDWDASLSDPEAGQGDPAEGSGSGRSLTELSPDELALREQVLNELRQSRGNVAAVARTLGKAPMQVRRWLRRFEIDPDSFRD